MALAEADVQAICEHIRREGKFPAAYKDRDFGGISLAQQAAIIAAAADASGEGHEHHDELRQMARTLEQGAKVYAGHSIPETYRPVKVGPTAIAFYPPASDPGQVCVLAEAGGRIK